MAESKTLTEQEILEKAFNDWWWDFCSGRGTTPDASHPNVGLQIWRAAYKAGATRGMDLVVEEIKKRLHP